MEPQTPSGPKPPTPPTSPPATPPPSATPPATPPATQWISPRLREKLSDGGDYEPPKEPRSSSPLPLIIIALLVVGGGIAGIMALRSNAAKQKAEADRLAQAARAESLATVARADSARLAAAAADTTMKPPRKGPTPASPPAGGTTAAATRPATKPAPAKPPAAGGAAAAAPDKGGPYGIEVATFLVQDRANSEQTRLAGETGLAGKVVTKTEDGGEVYAVVLGSFTTRATAEKRAEALVAKGQVNEARVVPLKP